MRSSPPWHSLCSTEPLDVDASIVSVVYKVGFLFELIASIENLHEFSIFELNLHCN
jgi:hypothetical protein